MAAVQNHDDNHLGPDDNGIQNNDIIRIMQNDPSFTQLIINPLNFPASITEWRTLGYCTGKNTHVKKLNFATGRSRLKKKNVDAFFDGVTANRSIAELTLIGCNLYNGELLQKLRSFIEGNRALRCLSIFGSRLGLHEVRSLQSTLKSSSSSLTRLELSCLSVSPTTQDMLIFAIKECQHLTDLNLEANSMKTARLAALILPQSKLKKLNISTNPIDDACVADFAKALALNSELNTLKLDGNNLITDAGWKHLSFALSSQHSRLRDLSIQECNINDEGVRELVEGLKVNHKLHRLDLRDNYCFSTNGWESLSNLLQSPCSRLKQLLLSGCNMCDDGAVAFSKGLVKNKRLIMLDLGENDIRDVGMVALSEALKENTTLSILKLNTNSGISVIGWAAFSIALPALKSLDISNVGIEDSGLTAFSNSISQHKTLETLKISGNRSITVDGWQAFAAALQSPNSNLRKVEIERNELNDRVIFAFSAALANNKKLAALLLDFNPDITLSGWQALSRLICDKSSPNQTFASNHTLTQLVGFPNRILPRDLFHLLRLNRRKNKMSVAMEKVVTTHFGGDFDMEPFTDMNVSLLVHFLGRISTPLIHGNRCERERLSTFFKLLRAIPSLLDLTFDLE